MQEKHPKVAARLASKVGAATHQCGPTGVTPSLLTCCVLSVIPHVQAAAGAAKAARHAAGSAGRSRADDEEEEDEEEESSSDDDDDEEDLDADDDTDKVCS